MSECTHDCSSCGESCGERTAPQDLREPANGLSHIGKVIAVVSGKGGVGKSLVTSSLAVAMRRLGKTVGVLDADITGPSIPTAFGIHTKAEGSELGIYPAETKTGIEIMSLNLLMEHETDPVVWRGPVIAGAVKMAEMMHIPVLGLVENYSYYECPDCGKRHAIFGESHIDGIAAEHGLPVLARLPIDPAAAAACDGGRIEDFEPNYLADVAKKLAE